MYSHNQLQLAEEEIKKGLKLKAVNRLKNFINSSPNEIGARTMLAQLYYEAGFYDAAGLYWMLTEPLEDRIKECTAIYKASVNYSAQQMLKDIKFRGDRLKLPVYALQILDALEAERYKKNQSSKTYNQRITQEANTNSGWAGMVVIIIVVLVFVFGFINGIRGIWNLFF